MPSSDIVNTKSTRVATFSNVTGSSVPRKAVDNAGARNDVEGHSVSDCEIS